MKRFLFIPFLLFFAQAVIAQGAGKKAKDIAAIKSMCGCYSITFDYAETFPTDTAYQLHAPYHAAAGAEWIFVEEESEDKIVIQHLLIVGENAIVKHWRQDWTYEEGKSYRFDGDLTWKYTVTPKKGVKGQWTQLVTQVDDSPRYTGSATWVHVDGRSYWESTADAPLPRREFSKRSDYNVMQRTNRHELNGKGWVHEQDNLKIVRKEGVDTPIVEEKGRNVYTKIEDTKCSAARDWWSGHREFWSIVRDEWEDIYSHHSHLFLQKKVDEKLMWEKMFELDREMSAEASSNPGTVRTKVHATLNRYISDEKTSESATY